MPRFAVTIDHPGTPAQLEDLARSFLKSGLSELNEHLGSSFNDADVDAANPARLRNGVELLLQLHFERVSYEVDLRVARRAAETDHVAPVRDRGRQTDIGQDF